MKEPIKKMPAPVVQRLTKYLTFVRELREKGVEWVSSQDIAEALGLTSSTVRQDITHLDFSGTSKRGYEIKRLEWAFYRELGADRITNVAIVGAGNMGRALALHGELERQRFMICALFDANAKLIGRKVGEIEVFGMDDLPRLVRARKIDIGMIAVPTASAQAVADALVAAGVHGILNLTLAHVRVPAHVAMVEARLVASLQELLYWMKITGGAPPPAPRA